MLFRIAAILLILTAIATPYDRPFVVDDANLLKGEELVELESRIGALNETYSCLMVIITVPTVSGQDIDKYCSAIARTWDVRSVAGKDDGVLLLVARDDGIAHLRIGTDYAGNIDPDRLKSSVAANLKPPFTQGEMLARFKTMLDELTHRDPAKPLWELLWIIPALLVLILVYANTFNRKSAACVSCGKKISPIVHRCPHCLALQPIRTENGSAPSIGLESGDLHRIPALRMLEIRFLMWQSTSFGGFTAGGPGELPKKAAGQKPFDGEAMTGGF